ncbi:dipeptidase [candidate division KSB1 bacterium]|nr:dipeptidase [candidate division KSB1 bacterium]
MMTRRTFIRNSLGALSLASVPSFAALATMRTQTGAKRAGTDVYQRAIAIDILTNDNIWFDVRQAIDAGLTAAVVDLQIYPRTFLSAVQALQNWNAAFKRNDQLVKVAKAADLQFVKQQKKFGVILSCQDASILDASTASVNDYNLQNLQLFYDLGIRVLQLTHNERNAVGDSFREKSNAGLSRLGEKVVASMNELGMLIDLSHCGDNTTMEAIQLSQKPCAITHAGCRALYPTLRNKPDEHIRAIAEKGGIFGVYNMSVWLTDRATTSIDDVLNHIDYAVKIAGVEHVAFGSDGPVLEDPTPEAEVLAGHQSYAKRNLGLPGAEKIPSHINVRELNSAQRLLRLAEALAKRGYKDDAIEKIIGGNFVRLFHEVCG